MWQFIAHFKLHCSLAVICLTTVLPIHSTVTDFDMYMHWLTSKPGNVIFSEFSIGHPLGLLLHASYENSCGDLCDGFNGANKAAMAQRVYEYFDGIKKNATESSSMMMASKIYVHQSHQLDQSFQNVAETKFHTSVEQLDFGDAVKSVEIINDFVKEKTNGKIMEFMQPNELTANLSVLFTNAICFKGNWDLTFSRIQNLNDETGIFHVSDSETIPATFVTSNGIYNYIELPDLDASAIELKLNQSRFSVVFILPNKRSGLTELESKFENHHFEDILRALKPQMVTVTIPMFKVEYDIEVKNFEKFGVPSIFFSNANLSGLLKSGDSVKVSKMMNKILLEINEQGTSFVVGGGANVSKRITKREDHRAFAASHPFMYFVNDGELLKPIFIGRIERI